MQLTKFSVGDIVLIKIIRGRIADRLDFDDAQGTAEPFQIVALAPAEPCWQGLDYCLLLPRLISPGWNTEHHTHDIPALRDHPGMFAICVAHRCVRLAPKRECVRCLR